MAATYQQRGSQSYRGSQASGNETSLITGQAQLNEAKAKLDRMKGEIEKIAGSLVHPDELVRFTLNACVKNPKLFECFQTAEGTASVFLSIITSRIIEIPCDGIHGYLVPFFQSAYKDRPAAMICQFMPGYKGFVQLAYANSNIASVNCAAVFEKDDFDFEYGTQPFLRHKPTNGESGSLAWAYAIIKTRSGHCEFRVLTAADVLKRKAVSKSSDKGPWKDWEPEMWAKTAFLSLAKVAPMGNKVARAAAIDDRIQTHGNLTTEQLHALKKEEQPALGYETPESAFSDMGDDRRETEPASRRQQQQREPDRDEMSAIPFDDQIADAMSQKALDTIGGDIRASGFDQYEQDRLLKLVKEARARIGQ